MIKQKPIWICVFIGLLIDQVSKVVANSVLVDRSVSIISDKILFQLVHNYGAAYGILQNQRWFLLTVSLIVIIGSVLGSRYLIQSAWSRVGLSFLMIGALGNFIDRLRLGYVIDFIDITVFPVFNVADVCIDVAIILFLIELWVKPNDSSCCNRASST